MEKIKRQLIEEFDRAQLLVDCAMGECDDARTEEYIMRMRAYADGIRFVIDLIENSSEKIVSPCFDCPDRDENCHLFCLDYDIYVEKIKEIE